MRHSASNCHLACGRALALVAVGRKHICGTAQALKFCLRQSAYSASFLDKLKRTTKNFVGKMLVGCWSDQQKEARQASDLGVLVAGTGFEPMTSGL